MEIDVFRIPLLVAGILTALVGIIAWMAPTLRTGRRVFGAILLLKGLALVSAALVWGTSAELAGSMLRIQPYLLLPLAPLAMYLVIMLSKQDAERPRRAMGAVLAVLVIGLLATYALDHGTVYSLARGEAGNPLQTAGSGWVYSGYGPLVFVIALPGLALSVLGLRFAQRAIDTSEPQAGALRLYALALIVNGLFDGGLATAYLIHDPGINGVSGLGWILGACRAVALLPAGMALGVLIGSELTKANPNRWAVLTPALLALGAWFSGPMPVVLGAPNYGQTWPTAVAFGIWRGVVAVVVAAGIWQARGAAPHRVSIGFGTAKPTADDA